MPYKVIDLTSDSLEDELNTLEKAGYFLAHIIHGSGHNRPKGILEYRAASLTNKPPAPKLRFNFDNEPDHVKTKRREAKRASIATAQRWLAGEFRILDTETNGWGEKDQPWRSEIIQIAILDNNAKALMDTFVKPQLMAIQDRATTVHGITIDMLQDAPSWVRLHPQLDSSLKGHLVLVYNAKFDSQRLAQDMQLNGLPLPANMRYECVMTAISPFVGEYDFKRNSWKYPKLTDICELAGIEVEDKAHSAIGDTQRTLGVIKWLAAQVVE